MSRESDAHAKAQEAMQAAGSALNKDPDNPVLQQQAVEADAALQRAEEAAGIDPFADEGQR